MDRLRKAIIGGLILAVAFFIAIGVLGGMFALAISLFGPIGGILLGIFIFVTIGFSIGMYYDPLFKI